MIDENAVGDAHHVQRTDTVGVIMKGRGWYSAMVVVGNGEVLSILMKPRVVESADAALGRGQEPASAGEQSPRRL